MLRRLFFLFPDELHAQRVVNQLYSLNIPKRRIHAIARNVELKSLPQATQRQKNGAASRIERFMWGLNLVVFAFAFIALVTLIVVGEFIWAMISLAIMVATFIAGAQFVVHVPNVHLTEFIEALSHGEILLIIDVPSNQVDDIQGFMRHKYPEAVVGGVSWSTNAFGL